MQKKEIGLLSPPIPLSVVNIKSTHCEIRVDLCCHYQWWKFSYPVQTWLLKHFCQCRYFSKKQLVFYFPLCTVKLLSKLCSFICGSSCQTSLRANLAFRLCQVNWLHPWLSPKWKINLWWCHSGKHRCLLQWISHCHSFTYFWWICST